MTKKSEISTLLLSLTGAILITLAQVSGNSALILSALAFFLALMVFAKDEDTIPLFLFFLPFSTILKLSPNAISFFSIATVCVFAVKCIKFLGNKFPTNLIICVVGISTVTLVSSLLNGYNINASYFMFMGMLIAFPLIFIWTNNVLKFEKCALFYSIGIILATVLSFIFVNNENLHAYINVFEDQTIVVRYCGFYGDPNFYAAQVVTAIGGQLLVISKKTSNKLLTVVLVIALIICGATSVSKSYILCLVLVITAWLFCQVQKGLGRFVKVLLGLSVIIAVALASGAFSGIIDEYLVRFGASDDASSLTTGRSELWKEYLEFLINNPIDLIIGQGYHSVFKGVRKGSHNTFIQCIYQLGLIGTTFFVFWISTLISSAKLRKVKISYVLLLVLSCFSMWMGLDMMFFDDLFLTIILFIMGMIYAQDELPQNNFSYQK